MLAASFMACAAAAATREGDLRQHIEYLASDALQGRKPGTEGERLAARYIAGALAGAGMLPAAADGGWYYPVPLVERSAVASATRWRVPGGVIPIDDTLVAFVGAGPRERIEDAPVVFAGFGLAPADAAVSGAIVLLMPGTPPGMPHAPTLGARKELLFGKGAAGVLVIARTADVWPKLRDQHRSARAALAGDRIGRIDGAIEQGAWRLLAERSGESPDALAAAANRPGFTAQRLAVRAMIQVETRIARYTAFNVVGKLPGTDPRAGRVVHLAHYDHLGICGPEDAADRICNGAVDNASGVAMLIEVARGLARDGPRPREQHFLATTAEELGLLGARAYVQGQGAEGRRNIVAALNYDTVAIAPKGEPVAIIGRGWNPALDAVAERAARSVKRKVDRGTAQNAFVARQDGWEFLKTGIPAIMAGGSFADRTKLNAFLGGPYHQADDDLGRPIELGGAAEDTDYAIALGRAVADPATYPQSRR